MDIWIIRNGEKTGPFRDFEIRHKIEDGELSPTTPAWHDGLPAWQPLGEIDLFRREFDLPNLEVGVDEDEDEEQEAPRNPESRPPGPSPRRPCPGETSMSGASGRAGSTSTCSPASGGSPCGGPAATSAAPSPTPG